MCARIFVFCMRRILCKVEAGEKFREAQPSLHDAIHQARGEMHVFLRETRVLGS